jgi:hypothetical protein
MRADLCVAHVDRRGAASWDALLVGPLLLGLAAFMFLGMKDLDLPEGGGTAVHQSQISTAPRREVLGDPPTIFINGFERTCMDCHRVFPPADIAPEDLQQHTHIVLNHGINDRCRNCHYTGDRDRLLLRGGETIGFSEVELLCAKCHGPTFHDWEKGIHGRTVGYWDSTRGEIRRLTCNECHDPHNPRVPAMDPLRPLPGPRTLRQVLPHLPGEGDHVGARDPLREAIERDPVESEPGEGEG